MKLNSFFVRTISGIVILALLASAFAMGGSYLLIFMEIIALIGVGELFSAISGGKKNSPMALVTMLATVALYFLIYTVEDDKKYLLIMVTMVILFMLLMGIYVFGYPRYKFVDIAGAMFAFSYISMMLSFVYLTRSMENGKYLVWLIVISSWGCDTCAYLVGSMLGKHKLAPVLSPKKSIEGAIGGVLGAMLIAFIYAYALVSFAAVDNKTTVILPIIAGLSAVFSQIGDLTASAIKRQYDIKDYGKIIPGHGGVLDRFDSMIVTAPVIFMLGVLIK